MRDGEEARIKCPECDFKSTQKPENVFLHKEYTTSEPARFTCKKCGYSWFDTILTITNR
jgi:transposase-like protein